MSHFENIPEQPEDVVARPAMWALGAAVLAIVACAVVVWTLGVFQVIGGGETARQSIELQPPARPFADTPTLERRQRSARDALDTWTWADRASRTVRVPVDVAIDRYLARYLEQRGAR
jgi:hypothetical protein